MRFHVLGVPHTVTNKEYLSCAYTQKAFKFCKMMKDRGHHVIHYGHEDSDPVCDEHVTVVTNDDFSRVYGTSDWRNEVTFKYDRSDEVYTKFYKNTIMEISKRKQKHDFLLPFWGSGVKPVCDAHTDMICVEPGIGYASGHWANFKVFESHALLHAYMGLDSASTCNPRWYDVVIPNYFDTSDFEFSSEKDNYFLFLGRVYSGKGLTIAIQMTEHIGAKLIVAGTGTLKNAGYTTIPGHVQEFGYANVENRKKLMSRAKAVITASQFLEPFCGVHMEAFMSGTPVISTDWGIFAETNLQGITGFRCRTFNDFVWAARNIHTISPYHCREWASNFTMDAIAPRYEKFFKDILNVHQSKGWYDTVDPVSHMYSYKYPDTSRHIEKLTNGESLLDIFVKHKCDKGGHTEWSHTYYKKYQELFEPIRHKKLRIFEMGIGTTSTEFLSNMSLQKMWFGYEHGASQRSWREYFTHPETEIFAGDIDPRVCDGITSFQVDQTNPRQTEKLFADLGTFDIIIDDGLHTQEAADSMFSAAYRYLRPGGYYIIEDIPGYKTNHPDLIEYWGDLKPNGRYDDNYLAIFRKGEIDDNKEEFEHNFWGDCINTLGEDQKQYIYAREMGLGQIQRNLSFILPNKQKIIDIGGGPTSLLLKTKGDVSGSLVVDPLVKNYPQWVIDRYETKGIKCITSRGEDLGNIKEKYDEVWMYNVLQHTDDPELILTNMKKIAHKMRIFEWIDIPPHEGHPHMITAKMLNETLGVKGKVGEINGELGNYGRYWAFFSN